MAAGSLIDRINPEIYYSEQDLVSQFGISLEEQRRGIIRGTLDSPIAHSLGVKRYYGASLIAWVRKEQSFEQKERANSLRALTTVRNAQPQTNTHGNSTATVGSSRAQRQQLSTLSKKQRWQAAVAANLAAGMDSAKARLKADRDNPGLRQQVIDEANGTATAKR